MFRCYTCDDEVPVEPESTLHNCIKLILKAMNLSPPSGDFNTRVGGLAYTVKRTEMLVIAQKMPQQELL